MKKDYALIGIGLSLVLVGGIWTAQGLGYLPGSVMTGVTFWAVVGPLVVIAGAWLLIRALRRRGRSQ